MKNINITNEQFLKMHKKCYGEDTERLCFLIAHDKNEKNLKAYNIILNKYFGFTEREIHIHGSWYEPTGVTDVEGTLPKPISFKLSKVYEKVKKEEELKEIHETLKNDPAAKAIFDQIEL